LQIDRLSGPLSGDTAELTGMRTVTDIAVDIDGRATLRRAGETIVIDLVVDDGRETITYQLVRDSGLSPDDYSGTWAVNFDESPSGCDVESMARYELDFTASGIGSGSATGDSAAGSAYGAIDVRSALATPAGFILVGGAYTAAPGADTCIATSSEYGLRLVGNLAERDSSGASEHGRGTAEYSLHPLFAMWTTWTAEREE
jgi:hypothetical protein